MRVGSPRPPTPTPPRAPDANSSSRASGLQTGPQDWGTTGRCVKRFCSWRQGHTCRVHGRAGAGLGAWPAALMEAAGLRSRRQMGRVMGYSVHSGENCRRDAGMGATDVDKSGSCFPNRELCPGPDSEMRPVVPSLRWALVPDASTLGSKAGRKGEASPGKVGCGCCVACGGSDQAPRAAQEQRGWATVCSVLRGSAQGAGPPGAPD